MDFLVVSFENRQMISVLLGAGISVVFRKEALKVEGLTSKKRCRKIFSTNCVEIFLFSKESYTGLHNTSNNLHRSKCWTLCYFHLKFYFW